MTTHLTLKTASGLTLTSVGVESVLEIDEERLVDFDYTLETIQEILNGPAYQWDGPQTMRVIAYCATQHLTQHAQDLELGADDFDLIREAIDR